ncbi:threonine synthase [Candidatus Gottesmanbacteria bacterium RIFCSPLOWO2_01_FULL_39_12b]|uniref:Threonine synthase n=1 Tax=Candidatus Gottesmanbacteria bacterium RIFCSPLOWO2_01_FULL_39_12b TaxID=1798388 RepID=A0A1F6ANL8_9BACT|nr:MAG: threonine synthase [Candidatus Gottesmanbacteria bacterium RIFCSPLOWO2_01_FULL_39_12b]
MNYLKCVSCNITYSTSEVRYRCDCGEILEVKITDWNKLKKNLNKKIFDDRLSSKEFPYQSGVWRYKELVLPVSDKYIITKSEGNTNLYSGLNNNKGFQKITSFVGLQNLHLKHEGENPTGSFKDRGMTVGITQAKVLGVKAVACASTGNTSSSLASYAAAAGLKCFVFLPKGKITTSKLSQSIAYGAVNIQLDGDFDAVMKTVQKVCNEYKIYLLNSINPFRIEGQKTIIFELLQQLDWQIPDWIVLPGGNLGNTSAIGKGLFELKKLGIINKLPRIAIIQAEGANPFYLSFKTGFKKKFEVRARTVASAIRIGNPVSFIKAKKIIEGTNGVVEQVSDQDILDAKAVIDASGIGCEPASAATVAGIKKLVGKKIIKKDHQVAGILTGHILKDPEITLNYHLKKLSGYNSRYANSIFETNTRTISREIRDFLDD